MTVENVKIPVTVLNDAANILRTFLCDREISFDDEFRAYVESVCYDLRRKQKSLELRAAYGKIVGAKSDDEAHNARINYLKLKREFERLWDLPF